MSDIINFYHKVLGNINEKSPKVYCEYNQLNIEDLLDPFYVLIFFNILAICSNIIEIFLIDHYSNLKMS